MITQLIIVDSFFLVKCHSHEFHKICKSSLINHFHVRPLGFPPSFLPLLRSPLTFMSGLQNTDYESNIMHHASESDPVARSPFNFFGVFSRVHATLQPALSVGWSVGRSVSWLLVRRSVGLHLFLIVFFAVLRLVETFYCPCPTARDCL